VGPVLDIIITRSGKNNGVLSRNLLMDSGYYSVQDKKLCSQVSQPKPFVSLNVEYPEDFSELSLPQYAAKTVKTENAGGSSVLSEAAAHMLLEHFTRVKNITLEIEIKYFFQGCSILDSLLELKNGRMYGISVTRAMQFSKSEKHLFTRERAENLLKKKVHGLFSARNSSLIRFKKMILLIWCQNNIFAKMLQEIWFTSFSGKKNEYNYSDIIVITPVCSTPWIYTDIA